MPAAAAAAASAASSSTAPDSVGPAPPDAFLCPITQELMADPVFAADGHSYERAEIEKWFATGKQTSPMTNSAMASQTLTANHGLKSQIKEWQGRSNAQRVADLITAVVLTDDATEIERQLGSLAQFVGQRKVVVQPQTLRKLERMVGEAPSAVHEALRVVEAECRLVVAGFAARLRDERRDQSLASAATMATKSKLAQLDIEISAAEEALGKLKKDRAKQASYVSGLERVEQECESSVAQVEKELNGYPEPLGLLEEAPSETGGSDEAVDKGQQTEAKRKRADGEEEQRTEVAKRQRVCIAGAGSSVAADCETLLREGVEWLYGNHHRVRDPVRGQLLIEAAAAAGSAVAVARCKGHGWGGHAFDTKASFDIYKKAAEQGDSDAQVMLGHCHDYGFGVEADKAEALKWYRKAAEQGNSDGAHSLGLCYARGAGVEVDTAEALKWYGNAAEQGNSDAAHSLGDLYFTGAGVQEDEAEAVKWYRNAAEQGHSLAQHSLGLCYASGAGVEEDMAAVVKWFRKAAEQGHIVAQYHLGIIFLYGAGVEEDKAEALKWFRKAAEQGHAGATRKLAAY
eukprot:COSAG03_NODE_2023_length_3207_cov_7.959459_1_plen_572_part_00